MLVLRMFIYPWIEPTVAGLQYLWKEYTMFGSNGGVSWLKSVPYQFPSMNTIWFGSTSRIASVISIYSWRSSVADTPPGSTGSLIRSYPPIRVFSEYVSAIDLHISIVCSLYPSSNQRRAVPSLSLIPPSFCPPGAQCMSSMMKIL